MVWVKSLSGKPVHICDGCGLGYADAAIALACEKHCKETKSCDPGIASKAIYRP